MNNNISIDEAGMRKALCGFKNGNRPGQVRSEKIDSGVDHSHAKDLQTTK